MPSGVPTHIWLSGPCAMVFILKPISAFSLPVFKVLCIYAFDAIISSYI